MRGPAQTSEPTIQFLYQLIGSLREGKILIPRFQRPLVWTWDRQSELLRSVKDGIPMGAIMLWRTSRDRIKSRDELAGHALPAPSPGIPREYLLDGLQRLSTLFAALRGFGRGSEVDGEARSPLGYDLEEEIFVESFDASAQPQIAPLHLLLDSVTLLRFQRGLKGERADIWIQRSDELAKSFREYKVPVISIASEEFEVAVRTFSLINSQGARMEETDMIHALTWTPNFELREEMESLRGDLLQPIGWGEIGLDTVLRVVKAEADLDLDVESVEKVSQLLKQEPNVLERAFRYLARAAELLRTRCGILNWKLVPYQIQAVLLADALRIADSSSVSNLDIQNLLVDWFWVTAHGETFAGVSGYRLTRALRDLRNSVGRGYMHWSGALSFRVRPIPTSGDLRRARMKAIALMFARRIREIDPLAADPFRILAEHGQDAIFRLIPQNFTSKLAYSNLGNRLLCAPNEAKATRQRLLSEALTTSDSLKYLISDTAALALKANDWDSFVLERFQTIAQTEQIFFNSILRRHPVILL